ncbi:MAG: type IV pilin N-terminal domain-containing protein [Methanosarcinales archaeon]|nr:type IV pilin N-terminal domain-containing protein [Methanosarcinales archaeon]
MEKKIEKKEIKKDEHAVSPVIGTILMGAITVILASVVGAIAFGVSSDLPQLQIVVVTAERLNSTSIDFTYAGGPSADFVQYLNVTVGEDHVDTTPNSQLAVGSTWTYTTSDTVLSDRNHVIAVATFGDGSAQVVLDTFV